MNGLGRFNERLCEPQREVLNLSQLVNFRLNLIHVVEAVHHAKLVHNPCYLVIIRFVRQFKNRFKTHFGRIALVERLVADEVVAPPESDALVEEGALTF